jgi:hypothetical protein
MFFKTTTSIDCIASLKTTKWARRLALATAIVFFGSTTASMAAYSFLPITSSFGNGNLTFAQFTSSNLNGIITVSHSFSAGGNGPDDNNNALIFPSNYSAIPGFAGTGNVQGHLAQTLYGNTSKVTFNMLGYNITPSTVFGMWNTTDEVAQPAYRIELINSVGNPVPPTTFTTFGTGDNLGAAGVLGRHQMVLNPATGDISAGATINGGVGIHTNALFWNNIPTGTMAINVYGNLGPIPGNNQGDGVGYYFAELVIPEPTSFVLIALGVFSLAAFGKRRR